MNDEEKLLALKSVFGGDSWERTAANKYTCTPMQEYDVLEFFIWGDDDIIRATFNYGNKELTFQDASKHFGNKPEDDEFALWTYDEELMKFADDVDDAYKYCFGY